MHEVVDSTQIPKKGGLAMFKIYKESNEKASLFDDFAKFDFREDHMRSERLKDPQND